MRSVLISACLMGAPVRYDGKGKPLAGDMIETWKQVARLVPLCPELAGGFSVPRPPAEIEGGMDGGAVLDGKARVVEAGGRDVTAQFVAGAEAALALARAESCSHAILIDGSPSCGSLEIHDGSFSGTRHAGNGVTAALLERNGIAVIVPDRIGALLECL
jgi:uncharacterized protein YbbK (DUF523 family)